MSYSDIGHIIQDIKTAQKRLQKSDENVSRSTSPEFNNLCTILRHAIYAYKREIALLNDDEMTNADLRGELKFQKKQVQRAAHKIKLICKQREMLMQLLRTRFGEDAINIIIGEANSQIAADIPSSLDE